MLQHAGWVGHTRTVSL